MLEKFSHIEMYVANIYQASLFYERIFGFSCEAKVEIKSVEQDTVSAYLSQGGSGLILTSPVEEKGSVAAHLGRHGDSIKDIAFNVKNVESSFEQAVAAGASPVLFPKIVRAGLSEMRVAKVATFGSIEHTLLELVSTRDYFLSYFANSSDFKSTCQSADLFQEIDHIAVCVESGQLQFLVNMYKKAFSLTETHEENVDTGKSGMNSKVLESKNGAVKIVFTEPMAKYKKSQIKEFINYNNGPGVQHVAFQTVDMMRAANFLKSMGVRFLHVPREYYEMRKYDFPEMNDKIEAIKSCNILFDKDSDGYLYQAFTQPLNTRPTSFIEIIQREGSKSFGSGNINTLFKSIELEQERRGAI